MAIEKIDNGTIEAELLEITKDQSIDEWKEKMYKAISGLLEKDPAKYRGFGPYWWGLKQEMVRSGYDYLGDSAERYTLEQMDYQKGTHNIMAAVLYFQSRESEGLQKNSFHYIKNDDEEVEYVLEDSDLEVILKYSSFLTK